MYFIYNAPNLYMQAVKTTQHTQQVVQIVNILLNLRHQFLWTQIGRRVGRLVELVVVKGKG